MLVRRETRRQAASAGWLLHRTGSNQQKQAQVSSEAAKKTFGTHSETLYLLSHPPLVATINNFIFLSVTRRASCGCAAFSRVVDQQELLARIPALQPQPRRARGHLQSEAAAARENIKDLMGLDGGRTEGVGGRRWNEKVGSHRVAF